MNIYNKIALALLMGLNFSASYTMPEFTQEEQMQAEQSMMALEAVYTKLHEEFGGQELNTIEIYLQTEMREYFSDALHGNHNTDALEGICTQFESLKNYFGTSATKNISETIALNAQDAASVILSLHTVNALQSILTEETATEDMVNRCMDAQLAMHHALSDMLHAE